MQAGPRPVRTRLRAPEDNRRHAERTDGTFDSESDSATMRWGTAGTIESDASKILTLPGRSRQYTRMKQKTRNYTLDRRERETLIGDARTAAANAYAPYSNFRVGAAVLGRRARYVGTNVENTSYGLTLCAERSALAAAVAAGDRDIRGIAVACIDALPKNGLWERVPCGACRQWILELAPRAEILIAGERQSFRITDLLPKPFRLKTRP